MVESPITNIKQYNRIYNIHSEMVQEFFPEKIPNNARNIRFYYRPSILQGGSTFLLYYVSYSDVSDLVEKYEKIDSLNKNKMSTLEVEDLYKNIVFNNTPYIGNELKSQLTIYLLDYKCDDSNYCNHGNYVLSALNNETNEIILLAETW